MVMEPVHKMYCIDASDVLSAADRIKPVVHKTPILTCNKLDSLASEGAADGSTRRAFFKCENFQRSGSFKYRGASNAVLSLPAEEAAKGVCTHSSGNHAQALALAAQKRGIPAYIVMPHNAPASKKAAVTEYGGKIIECEATQSAREKAAAAVASDTGACFIHPSENPQVIAGQGTLALEMFEQIGELLDTSKGKLDAIIVPIGGGGMTSGIAIAMKTLHPEIKIIAAEPTAAGDAYESKKSGELKAHSTPPNTIADGLKTTLGANTWPIVRGLVDQVITVSEEEIASAMRTVYERMKLVIEPSAGVSVAVLLCEEFKKLEGIQNVGVVLCGGNVDVTKLPF